MNPHYHKHRTWPYFKDNLCIGCGCCAGTYYDYEDTKLTEPNKEQPKDK